MATGKYLAAVIIFILAVYSIFFFLSKTPEPALDCKSGDSICPQGCSYQVDQDCARTGVTSYGEVHSCIVNSDCVIANPLCGNSNCNFIDKECQSGNFCATAINKNYKSAWDAASVHCVGTVPKCSAQQSVQAFCINGECKLQGVI
ncbi:MAG: hypothetical protein HYT16_04610 [DPANN group archaeon]|nr:hypothetical protein [DPANN group archaeon]